MNNKVTIGLYRHFKGKYFYVTGIFKSCYDYRYMVSYFNVCKPERGSFTRFLDDFVSDIDESGNRIADREDNITGQIYRFERIKDLNFQLGSVSTEQLICELRKRTDSPIHALDIEGLQSKVFSTDYVVGVRHGATEETPAGIDTLNVFFTKEEAEDYFSKQVAKARKGVFKRTFIEVD